MKILALIIVGVFASSCAHQAYNPSYTDYGFYGHRVNPYGSSTWNGTAWRPGTPQELYRPIIPYAPMRMAPLRFNRAPASGR